MLTRFENSLCLNLYVGYFKPLHRTLSITLPPQTEITQITLNTPCATCPLDRQVFFFLQTHGVRRLSISAMPAVVTNLHNTNTPAHITLGLSGSFKVAELSHSIPSALAFCIPLGLDCCVNALLFTPCASHSITVPLQLSSLW